MSEVDRMGVSEHAKWCSRKGEPANMSGGYCTFCGEKVRPKKRKAKVVEAEAASPRGAVSELERECPTCEGSGAVYVDDGDGGADSERCDTCAGEGRVVPAPTRGAVAADAERRAVSAPDPSPQRLLDHAEETISLLRAKGMRVEAEVERLRDLLTEAHRQDFGTPGWRQRVRSALDEERQDG